MLEDGHGEVAFGAAHIPTRYESLNGSFSFKYVPVHWTLNMRDVSWRGSAPDLDMTKLLTAILHHPQFVSTASRQGLVKQPAEWVAGVMRSRATPSTTGAVDELRRSPLHAAMTVATAR